MPTLLRVPFARYYKAPLVSEATILITVICTLTLILPFILAYSSQSFWLKINSYREQPQIRFKKSLVLILGGTQSIPNTNIDKEISLLWSTDSTLNQLMSSYIRIPTIKVRNIYERIIRSVAELDTNNDGRNDYLTLKVSVPLLPTEKIQSVRAILIFDYQISSRLSLKMESACTIDLAAPNSLTGATSLSITGDLVHTQRTLLTLTNFPISAYTFNSQTLEPVINFTSLFVGSEDIGYGIVNDGYVSISESNWNVDGSTPTKSFWDKVIDRYLLRDDFKFNNPIWKTSDTSGTYFSSAPNSPFPAPPSFSMALRIIFPEDTFYYRPGPAEVLKHGWIQYFAFLVIVTVIANWFFTFAIKNFIVPSYVTVDRVPTSGHLKTSEDGGNGWNGFKAHPF
ncbi:hypothetical protein HK096_007886 [Nowakowskiella sp. JEL0078]|nr:hypothetical protein HK096_007886 [Nowakowskiella sp. JEL0078]